TAAAEHELKPVANSAAKAVASDVTNEASHVVAPVGMIVTGAQAVDEARRGDYVGVVYTTGGQILATAVGTACGAAAIETGPGAVAADMACYAVVSAAVDAVHNNSHPSAQRL
ncbi:MAG: hypothetical protein KGJ86_07780, partial [Chloroflexota bacterium]|nr:hypothetical protein [Chloroflexota bacterium]